MNKYYKDYGEYLAEIFPGRKVQKISINSGGSCPNRDGTIGRGGCIYCNNTSFTPSYCFNSDSIMEQFDKGVEFFSRKYPEMWYMPYFQSFTSTYGVSPTLLEREIRALLSKPRVCGLVIGTRPDCLDTEMVKMLGRLNKEIAVFVELGVESLHDSTLRLIHRGHDSESVRMAVEALAAEGIHVGVHLIAGLPTETEEDMLATVRRICEMPVEVIKMHHLQVLRDTQLLGMIERGEIDYRPWTAEAYLDFCAKVVGIVPRSIAIERFTASAPSEMVVSPKWGLKNYEFTNLLISKLRKNYE